MELDEPCRQAGYAIASRTYACTGDSGLANDRYLAFSRDFTCKNERTSADALLCAGELNELSCESALAFGDRLEAWVGSSVECMLILGSSTRTIAPSPPGDLARSPDCEGAVRWVATRRAACGGTYEEAFSWASASLDSWFSCYSSLLPSAFGRASDLERCRSGLEGLSCDEIGSRERILNACDYVFSPR
jgi:hypothetical protein